MSTMEATISMLEAMPEEARLKVLEYTQQLFRAQRPANPFIPAGEDDVLRGLEEARIQHREGKGLLMEEALTEMGKTHGFL